ncbi:MAG: RNA polymerase sigma factor FliA [Pseudomonadota bacterium]
MLSTKEIERIINQYASLVKRIGHHLLARLPANIQLDDLIQAGMLGLIEAAKKFDENKGASFETYAGIRIRGAMLDEVRRGDWTPRSVHRHTRDVYQAIRRVEQRLGRDARESEIAIELGIPLEEYHQKLGDSMSARLFSLQEIFIDGNEDSSDRLPIDSDGPAEQFEKFSLFDRLVESINKLPEREKLVLSLYYDEEMNLKEIGKVLGVTESRVSQIHSQAALRLRAWLSGPQADSSD